MLPVQFGEQQSGYNLLSKHQIQHPEKAFPAHSCLGCFKNLTHPPLYCAGRMVDHPGVPGRAGVFELGPHLLTKLSDPISPTQPCCRWAAMYWTLFSGPSVVG